MSVEGHGRAPGPGHALVVRSQGFSVSPNNRPGLPGLHLSGEGALACAWLVLNPHAVIDASEDLTADQVGTYIQLPIDDRFGLQILTAIGAIR